MGGDWPQHFSNVGDKYFCVKVIFLLGLINFNPVKFIFYNCVYIGKDMTVDI